jgi:PIN domain nuclease of toxin-antitoxin system
MMNLGENRNPIHSINPDVRAALLLLDTHVWIWMLEQNQHRLSEKVLQHLRERGKAGEILVSDISFWEVANKSRREKLFSMDAMIWMERAGAAPGVTHLPLARTALIQSTRLPGKPPADPADRILIATAQLNGASLVTCDAAIIAYARAERGLTIVDARTPDDASHR